VSLAQSFVILGHFRGRQIPKAPPRFANLSHKSPHHLVRNANDRRAPFVSAVASAVSVGLLSLLPDPAWAGLFLLGIGMASGVMTVYFQILISAISSAEQRGSAMALGGLGWGMSNLSTPLIVGALSDAWGIQVAFHALGLIVLLVGIALPPIQQWAFRDTRAAKANEP
jgi:MFS family permease